MQKNKRVVLVIGESSSGKTASLEFIKDQPGVMYLNCESGKDVSFEDSQMQEYTITDPYQVYEAFDVAETKEDTHTIVVDGFNYLMDMFESVHIIGSANTMAQWAAYAQFIKNMFQQYVPKSTKTIIFIAHVDKELGPNGRYNYMVPVKGAMKGKIESFFTSIVCAKKMGLDELEDYKNDMLTYNEEETVVGVKYVFQTRLTADTIDEKVRNPKRLFSLKETYIDNNAQLLLDKLNNYYGIRESE